MPLDPKDYFVNVSSIPTVTEKDFKSVREIPASQLAEESGMLRWCDNDYVIDPGVAHSEDAFKSRILTKEKFDLAMGNATLATSYQVVCEMGEPGKGVFTQHALPEGLCIGIYTGLFGPQVTEHASQSDTDYHYGITFNGISVTIDAKKYGNITRFYQHLPEKIAPEDGVGLNDFKFHNGFSPEKIATANVKPVVDFYENRPIVSFITTRPIKRGEQIGYDYSPGYWSCILQAPCLFDLQGKIVPAAAYSVDRPLVSIILDENPDVKDGSQKSAMYRLGRQYRELFIEIANSKPGLDCGAFFIPDTAAKLALEYSNNNAYLTIDISTTSLKASKKDTDDSPKELMHLPMSQENVRFLAARRDKYFTVIGRGTLEIKEEALPKPVKAEQKNPPSVKNAPTSTLFPPKKWEAPTLNALRDALRHLSGSENWKISQTSGLVAALTVKDKKDAAEVFERLKGAKDAGFITVSERTHADTKQPVIMLTKINVDKFLSYEALVLSGSGQHARVVA